MFVKVQRCFYQEMFCQTYDVDKVMVTYNQERIDSENVTNTENIYYENSFVEK